MRVLVIDTEVSNLRSVVTALKQLHYSVEIISTAMDLHQRLFNISRGSPHRSLPPLIFPGVGEARSTMESLSRRGIDGMLRRFVDAGGTVLGICVGAQLLLQKSEERDARGIGVVRGTNRHLVNRDMNGERLKIPQIGWNTVRFCVNSPLFRGIPQESAFYFVHSYCLSPTRHDQCIAWSTYGNLLSVSFAADNRIFGVQFHPEKSGPYGLQLLNNFVNHAKTIGAG